jgi:hypothetical protein
MARPKRLTEELSVPLPPGTKIEMAELIDGPLATFWREKMLTWLATARAEPREGGA